MRISTIAAVVLVLLAGAVGYYFGAQQRHFEPDAWGLASDKLAFSNRYDCELDAEEEAEEQDAKDEAEGRALIAKHPELLAKFRAEAAKHPELLATPQRPGCEPLTFAQVRARRFDLMPRGPAPPTDAFGGTGPPP
jgi:hypothetical protein